MKKVKVKGNHVIFALVLLVTGFIFTKSYQMANHRDTHSIPSPQWREEDELRNEILVEQKKNRELAEELRSIQLQISQIEEEIAEKERTYFNLVEDLDRLRMITGDADVVGEGISVILHDAEYVQDGENPNDYIVHEQHIQMVIDELLVAGAEAIAINGHRINHQTYIQCVGPVIEIDGEVSFAPFEISAIGDQETLYSALSITGGVIDYLLSDNIEVKVQEQDDITLQSYYAENG